MAEFFEKFKIAYFWLRLLCAHKAGTKSKLRLYIGAHYIKKGACIRVGQPIKLGVTERRKEVTVRYVDNIYYNFKANRINPKLSKIPIKGYSEPFLKHDKK